jgi:hypothetical protein
MADDDSTEKGSRRPAVNVYTAMLVLAFLAISIGCIVLALDLARYDFQIQPRIAP